MIWNKQLCFIIAGVLALALAWATIATLSPGHEKKRVLEKIVHTFPRPVARIAECNLEGKKIYTVDYNMTDSGGAIFDETGAPLSLTCGCGVLGCIVPPQCQKIEHCTFLYKAEKNMVDGQYWDPYELGPSSTY